MEIWQVGIVVLFLLGILVTWINNAKKKKAKWAEEERLFKIDLALHPELYYVSQGGTMPDPEPVEEQT